MERIRLSKIEKRVLRLLTMYEHCPDTFPDNIFASGVRSLERKGLAKGMYASGNELVAARLTSEGADYLSLYPTLRNPVNWGVYGAIGALLSGIVALIALLVACGSI